MIFSISSLMRRSRMKVVQPLRAGSATCDLHVILCDTDPNMIDAWVDAFFGVSGVEKVLHPTIGEP
jgi:hypothetical protein